MKLNGAGIHGKAEQKTLEISLELRRERLGNNKKEREHMKITMTREETRLTVALEGRLDTTTAPELEKVLKENLDSVTGLTLDFAKLDYISSAGLRMLLSLQKKMMKKGGMKLVGVNDAVNDVFEVTGFDEILTYEKR